SGATGRPWPGARPRSAFADVRRSRRAFHPQRTGRDDRRHRGPAMMRAYIVDDERLAVERLQRLLEKTGRVTIAGTETDPEAALAFLEAHDVDVLFLDIQMPGLTGFELLERLNRDVPVIFTTAYDQYAIDAFTVHSVDYLLKPIDPDRLTKA